MLLTFNVEKQIIMRTDTEKVVTNSMNYLYARFTFSEEWTGEKTAVFSAQKKTYNALLDENNTCLVPWEALTGSIFTVSVFCGDLITANKVIIYTIPSGYEVGDESRIPTPEIYTQVIEKLNEIEQEIDPEAIQQIVDTYLADKDFVTENDVETIVSQYVAEHVHGVPTGGTTGQVLVKSSSTDYATKWADGGSGSGDMTKSTYDPNGVVEDAGGIEGYVGEEIEPINSVFVPSRNILDFETAEISENHYLNYDGSLVSHANYNALIIPCEAEQSYVISACSFAIVYLDSNKTKISASSISNVYNLSVTTPANTAYLGFSVVKSAYSPFLMVTKGTEVPDFYITYGKKIVSDGLDSSLQSAIEKDKCQYGDAIPLQWVAGYVDYQTGGISSYTDGSYWRTVQPIRLVEGMYYKFNGHSKGLAGIAFYSSPTISTANKVKGVNASEYECFQCPVGAPYAMLSDYHADAATGELRFFYDAKKTNELLAVVNDAVQTVIACTGDSITEGMNVTGSHYANYGDATYPARLTTLLVDNGYTDTKVINQGHGGENTSEITARVGGFACITNADITLPANNDPVNISDKLIVPFTEGDKLVVFDQLSHDTNPVNVGGVVCTLSISNGSNFIAKANADNKETVIPKGSFFFTNDTRNPSVNVIYSGVNDGANLTMARYIEAMKGCGSVNGGKYIILGSTHAIWSNWSDLSGTVDEKYAEYKETCVKELGVHFIDLYAEFPAHAIEYALESGYLSTLTTEELEAAQAKLDSHIMPSIFTVDGVENNVHLNEAGYQVMAMLVYNRLKLLSYI